MSFKRFDPQDFLISADTVVGGAWSGGSPSLTKIFTSSIQESATSGDYYLSIFQTGSTLDEAAVQFNIAFGEKNGSGSLLYDSGIDGKSPTSTVYGQFQNIVIGDENTDFEYGGITPNSQSFYALTIERARYKGNLYPGTFNLYISGAKEIQLTDNSKDVTTQTFNEAGRVYQIVSGSNGSATSATPTGATTAGMTVSGSYGLFLPDIGVILLNGKVLDLPVANGGVVLGTSYASNTNSNNPAKLFVAISHSMVDETNYFQLNSQEAITSDYVFVRARNGEFNYSENPSFISGSTGAVIYDEFINAPQTFITSVGMYNDNNELLAVAKLSKPLKKDFTKEALIRVKLDF